MMEGTKCRGTLLLLCNALILAAASPVFMPQFLPGGTGRNIRHLPCVSRRTGETGVCMFAFTCVKANGTHLGTCIDRFYFGSCCKIDGEPDIFPHDNTIDDGPVKPYLTNSGSHESNNIPEYPLTPTLTPTKLPVRVTEAPVKTTQTTTTTQEPMKVVEKPLLATTIAPVSDPAKVTVNTNNKHITTPVLDFTTDSIGLSTFQTIQKNPPKTLPTPRPTLGLASKPPQKISTTVPAITNGQPSTPVNILTSTVKPSQRPVAQNATKIEAKPINKLGSKPAVAKPVVTKPVIKPPSVKPPVVTSDEQSGGSPPIKTRTTTAKPITATPSRPLTNVTRFPPRNATTTTTSTSTTTTTLRPPRPTSNRRPIITTTKKPTSTPIRKVNETTTATTTVNRRPVPSTPGPTPSSRPSTVAGSLSITTPAGDLLTAKPPTTPNISEGGNQPTSPGRPAVTATKPTISSTTVVNQQTTRQPPRPSSRPTPTPVTPSVVGDSSRLTSTVKPPATQLKPITTQTPITKAPLKKPTPSSSTVTIGASPITKRPITTSSTASPPPSTLTSLSTSTISNGVISLDDTETATPGYDANKVESTTSSPGLVTWTSNLDDVTTKAPLNATSTPESEEPTNTEWTPITTPDGWILIQSPSPNEPDEHEDALTIRPIIQSTVFGKPVPSSSTERSTTLSSLPTVATMTTTTDNLIPTAELNMSDYKQVCGRRLFPESRIVGGTRSAFGKWPWQISLRQWRTSTYLHKCGAALLNENWAITAAHCVANVPASDLLLRLGEHDLASEDEPYGFQERRVQLSALHPQFDPRTFEYDLALLRFYEPLSPFQPNTLPICLPDDDESYVGLTAHVTGWGRLWDDGPLPSVLQEVPVRIINNTVCEEMYRTAGYIEYIPNIFICAGWRKGGYDSCEGDSGGPLVIQRPKDKRWVLAGVISWGIGCAEPNQPGVYTRISEFREWINQILQF